MHFDMVCVCMVFNSISTFCGLFLRVMIGHPTNAISVMILNLYEIILGRGVGLEWEFVHFVKISLHWKETNYGQKIRRLFIYLPLLFVETVELLTSARHLCRFVASMSLSGIGMYGIQSESMDLYSNSECAEYETIIKWPISWLGGLFAIFQYRSIFRSRCLFHGFDWKWLYLLFNSMSCSRSAWKSQDSLSIFCLLFVDVDVVVWGKVRC